MKKNSKQSNNSGARNGSKGKGISTRRSTPGEIIERGIPGFSMLRYETELNYYHNSSFSTGAGAPGTYVFSTNGCYDPDITGTGHQPMAFDQMMLSFEHYTCVSSKIKVIFRNNSTMKPVNVAIGLNAGATPVGDYTRFVENGLLVRDMLNDATSGYGSMKELELYCSISKFGGVPNLLDNPDYKGTIASNPVEQSYFHITTWNPYDSNVVDVLVDVFITYRVIFTEPRKNGLSGTDAIKAQADALRSKLTLDSLSTTGETDVWSCVHHGPCVGSAQGSLESKVIPRKR